ncbi:hypothetical protein BCR37DRAFT_264295 [Protomyces lactucae-debilis]|uniref:Uncharacterized protein n=1 Tax=Protomyces lactucae-debilis TaxID=2754530 RepID=A0A1Y2FNN9_PROLT|nr:uncharacterized protein BCR37DRAFT_264295 [Protomyces lactucae-debilis]ORY84335.1 hypothetical protein BCR37DRAFT_264295 [Protomyces lactucae-debilis]
MISLKYVGIILLTVIGVQAQDNILYKDFCYYNGSHLPQLHRTCPDKPTTEICYHDYPSNYTASVDDYMAMVITVDYSKHPGKILICGGQIPAWVNDTCFWFARHYFSCGARGAPKYNARIIMSEEYVDVGSLDLKTQIYDMLPQRTEESGASDGRRYTTQTNLCWNEAELGTNAVKVSYDGHWGSVGNKAIKDHPVLLRGDKIGQLLVKTLIHALEAMKNRTTYWQYNCKNTQRR